jgi:inner membrane protein
VPSILSHTVVSAAAGLSFAPRKLPKRFWVLSIVCSIVPDADVITFGFGIPYGHFMGHRGFFHSPFFGLLFGLFITVAFFRDTRIFSRRWTFFAIYFFLLTASHGILDAFTNGGLGIALLAPFDNTRYFFPWTPIVVSPIGVQPFFSQWGLAVIKSEILWIWFPALIIVLFTNIIRRLATKRRIG